MILYIDTTDNEGAEVVFVSGTEKVSKWFDRLPQAEDFANVIKKFLQLHKHQLSDITKLAVKVGPGFYSRVRTGVVAANALAFGLGISVVSVSGPVDFRKIAKARGQGMATPVYGGKPNITKPKRK